MRRVRERSGRFAWQELTALHAWRASTLALIVSSVLLLTMMVVVAAGSQRMTTTPTPDLARAVITPHSLPTVPAAARATPDAQPTPTPRVIRVADPTPTMPSHSTAPVAITNEAETPSPPANPTATPLPPTESPPPVTATPAPAALARQTFSAEHWRGGYYRGDGLAYGRAWVAVYGAQSAYPKVSLSFTLPAAPGEDATLSVTGLDDEWAELNEISLAVNGEEVFAGPSPFLNWDGVGDGANAAWTAVAFRIPAESLRPGGNELVLSNLTPAANFNAPPYVLLADAALEVASDGGAAPQSPAITAPPTAPSATAAGIIPTSVWEGVYRPREPMHFARPWVAIYGELSVYSRATAAFRLDAAPTGPATLMLNGIDDEWLDSTPLVIEVNGEQVYSGASPFANWDGTAAGAETAWTPAEITIPPELLRPGRNRITVINLSPAANIGSPPYVLLGDASLQAPGATVTALEPEETSP
jgi:hypothetical protein